MIKEDDMVDGFAEFKASPGKQFYPKPKPAEYFKGNLAKNLLGIMLFQYQKGTMELEFVHRNFFLPTSEELPYMIIHIHTDIKYSVQSREAILKVINEITQNITLVTQYNIRYGSSGTWRRYDGFHYNFTSNPHGVTVDGFTQSTINQLKQGFKNRANQYPDYHEQVYYSSKTKAYKWYLDYLYQSTGMHLYLSKYAPELLYN